MLPDVWLSNDRIRKLRTTKFPSQPKSAFIQLAESMFGGLDLNRTQVSQLIKVLTESEGWPVKAKTSDEEELDLGALPARPDATPDWILMGIGMLISVQPGTSVLDLFCGAGTFAQTIPLARCYYEGYDIDKSAIELADKVFRGAAQFYQTDITEWLEKEPDSQYGVVFAHPPFGLTHECQHPCLELQPAGQIDVELATFELAVKACSKGGLVVIVTESNQFGLDPSVSAWLAERGTVLVDVTLPPYNIVVFRNGVKLLDFTPLGGALIEPDSFVELCSEWAQPIRTPICSEDPRPLVLKTWEIEVVPNGSLVSSPLYGKRHKDQPDAELFKGKHRVGVRWAWPWVAAEWAQLQALSAPREEAWYKTVDRFNRRFAMDTYLDLRESSSPNDILNLPPVYTVGEEAALTKFMQRLEGKVERTALSYPEKSTLDNRYYTLGPGCTLRRGDERWRVSFSEPDFSNSKPPKVHIETV